MAAPVTAAATRLLRLPTLTAFIVASIACAESPDPPELRESTAAIVNGTRQPTAVPLRADQIMAIGYLHPADSVSSPFCTGTIVAPSVVITAAHCTREAVAADLGFSLGELPEQPAEVFSVSAIYNHPNADVAALVLTQDTTGIPGLTPIEFNRQRIDDSWVGQAVEVAGYGDTFELDRYGRWFAALRLSEVRDSHVVVDGEGQRGLCGGDSGAPSIVERADGTPVVIGVESGGDPTCVDRDFMVRLDVVKDWIDDVLSGGPNDACEDIPTEGQCVRDVLQSCDRGVLTLRDCTTLGATCIDADQHGPAACSCADIRPSGRCNGDTSEVCVGGKLVRDNCQARGLTCGWTPAGVFGCTNVPDCGGVGDFGFCAGQAMVLCEEGAFRRTQCHGAMCVLLPEGATCVTPEGETFGRGAPVRPPPPGAVEATCSTSQAGATQWWRRR